MKATKAYYHEVLFKTVEFMDKMISTVTNQMKYTRRIFL